MLKSVSGRARLCLYPAVFLTLAWPACIIGYRLGLWPLAGAFSALALLFFLTAAVAAASLLVTALALLKKQPASAAVIALALCLIPTAIAAYHLGKGTSLPPIHDITTDTDNPPQFKAAQALRNDRDHAIDYQGDIDGDEVARQQRRAYPDIQPIISGQDVETSFQHALRAVREMGLEVVSRDPDAGRLEAVATTALFGFKDDLVIRIRALPDGDSRLDIRSQSRVGDSDLGANAARIRKFARLFKAQ